MIPLRDDIRSRTFPVVNYVLIALNVMAFVMELGMGERLERFLYQAAVVPVLFAGRDASLSRRGRRASPGGSSAMSRRPPSG